MELHVKDLGDDDVLLLTNWAWERCVSTLGSLKDMEGAGGWWWWWWAGSDCWYC
jgi:hypothetical protein